MATATQKKSYAARLGVLAVALSLVTACLLGGTMAKYVTEVTGTGSATVAKWSFTANGKTDTFGSIDLAKTAYTNVAEKKIAPGTEGSFDIVLDASGSDVAVDYTIAFSNLQNKPKNLKFYSDKDKSTEISDLATALTGTIELKDVGTAVTKTVYWDWAIGSSDADNSTDTANGTAAKSMTFDIAVTGTQKTPVAPAA
ncbi:hypothetical protein [Gordonibacter sp. RACS_AR68]|uniref:hypothetical protein n=1 Tax=Gordonibacter sp. RACS_AR68 TaxID=2872005 RepID=UPI00260E1801|nr:hypothetical protein [Gordonibacter sp. RACS_AR68]MDN4469665.1 hypothetical protein [Gordonibacter sp. RACS_AR68]